MKPNLSFIASTGDNQGSNQRRETYRQKVQAAGKREDFGRGQGGGSAKPVGLGWKLFARAGA